MGNVKPISHQTAYVNVMELLVNEEVDRQLKKLPERVLKYVKRQEVETYALNRLPALYASSEKGLQHQYERAQHEMRAKIQGAVRQALAAVQVDPIRLSQPIQVYEPDDGSQAVLQFLREWLRIPDLDWKTALLKIRQIQRRGNLVQSGTVTASTTPQTSHSWRPGTYGSQVAWKPRYPSALASSASEFDWEDSRYRQ
ncbi:MAG: late competence development ComFB family protein [Leptolyngbyaceae cyanobacterium T60_A2020_046]|nr:late competence development ComFB family protein [Leptolyngbyaceae cyanobacterium T60_A2020_046]